MSFLLPGVIIKTRTSEKQQNTDDVVKDEIPGGGEDRHAVERQDPEEDQGEARRAEQLVEIRREEL